jgi:hypothetical protein
MVSDILICDGEKNVVLFESFSDKVEICLFNPLLRRVTSKQEVINDPKFVVSSDRKYLVAIEDTYEGIDMKQQKMNINC